MKKQIITLFAFVLCLQLSAQEFWFEAGLKGGAGMSFLYNKNIVDDSDWDYAMTPMFGVGAKFSMNFGPYHGVFLEGLYNKSKQDFIYNLPISSDDFDYSVEWSSIDLYVLYRGIRNRTYFEIGPMYSMIQKVEQGSPNDPMAPTHESTDYYESGYLGGAFGFGGYVIGSETFSMGIGIRLNYGFLDVINQDGQTLGYPNEAKITPYAATEKTNPMFAQFLVEFNFGVGRFAKTACSERFKRIRRR